MKLVRETSPYIRREANVSRMMLDVIIALLPLVVFSIIGFGIRSLLVIAVSVAVMVLSETLFMKYSMKKKLTINNYLVPIISGIIYALLLPSTVSIYVVVVGALFGIFIGKLVFGGTGHNIVNPAGIGRAFVGICFGSTFTYNNVVGGATALGQLKENGLVNFTNVMENYSLTDLFLGNVPGSMGEVCKYLILVGGIYLFVRRSADVRTFLSSIFTYVLLSALAGLVLKVNVLEFTLFQLLTGGFLFGAVFMITDPVTTPITSRGRVLYGTLVAGLTILIRFFGAYPEGMVFSIVLMNLCVPLIDYHKFAKNKYTLKYGIFTACVLLFFVLVVVLAL